MGNKRLITGSQRDLMFNWLNDMWFKEGIMSYSDVLLVKKLLQQFLIPEYSNYERIELNQIRKKWKEYLDNGRPNSIN